MTRLGRHYAFQGAQRTALDMEIENSKRDPHNVIVFSIDKMDQLKSVLPHSFIMRKSAFFKQGARFVTGLTCVLIYALSTGALVYSSFEDYAHGSSYQLSLFLDIFTYTAEKLGHLPKIMKINADNTYKVRLQNSNIGCNPHMT